MRMRKRGMAEYVGWSWRVLFRYLLFQLPGWIIPALILLLIDHWFDLPTWVILSAVLILIAKDGVMFPFVWRAYDPNPVNIAYRLIGERAIARGRLSPSGHVRVHGELWKAELVTDNVTVEKGQAVRIRNVRGLTLLVQPEQ